MELIPYHYHPCQLWAQHRSLADSLVWARYHLSLGNESISFGCTHRKTMKLVTEPNYCCTSPSPWTDRHTPHGAVTVHPGWYREGWKSPLGWGWAPWPALLGLLVPLVDFPSDPSVVPAASQHDTHRLTKTLGSLQKIYIKDSVSDTALIRKMS